MPLEEPPLPAQNHPLSLQLSARQWWLPLGSAVALFPLVRWHSASGVVHALADFLGKWGNSLFIVASIGLFLWWARQERNQAAFWRTLDLIVCSFLSAQGFKLLFHWPRPSGSPTGFPSGHTQFAFSLAWVMLQTKPRLAPLWFAVAVAIGWSRVESGAHYPYQVLVGAPLGLLLGYGVTALPKGILLPRFWRRKRRT